MTVAAIGGYLLAGWVVGFTMGHTWKFFRRLVESA